MIRISYAGLLVTFGIAVGLLLDESFAALSPGDTPGFLIVAGRTVDPEGLDAYVAAAGEAIASAGLQRVARSAQIEPKQILEGSWPYAGFVAIEQFQSLQQVLDFWHSEDFRNIKKLREGKIAIDFVVAVEAQSGTLSR